MPRKACKCEAQNILLYRDSYIEVIEDLNHNYTINFDKRRKVNQIVGDNWAILFFGNGLKIRKGLKGRTVRNNKNLLITIYGRKERTYIIYNKRKVI